MVLVALPTWEAGAAWGSIHANNRSMAGARAPGREFGAGTRGGAGQRAVPSAPAPRQEVRPGGVEGRRAGPQRGPGPEVRGAPPREEFRREEHEGRDEGRDWGAFYVQEPQGFVVVAPPVGITVPALPPGATPLTINGVMYYQFNGTYYLPVMQNGATAFSVVQP